MVELFCPTLFAGLRRRRHSQDIRRSLSLASHRTSPPDAWLAVQSARRAEAIPRIRHTDVYLRAQDGKGGVRQPKRATSERTLGWYGVLGAFCAVGAYGVAVAVRLSPRSLPTYPAATRSRCITTPLRSGASGEVDVTLC